MKYKTRRMWRHLKYKLLELFFGKPELSRLIDLDKLDFEDAVILKDINTERWLTKKEYDYFNEKEPMKYGLQYALARQMAETLASHVKVSELWDMDKERYLCIGTVTIVEKKK